MFILHKQPFFVKRLSTFWSRPVSGPCQSRVDEVPTFVHGAFLLTGPFVKELCRQQKRWKKMTTYQIVPLSRESLESRELYLSSLLFFFRETANNIKQAFIRWYKSENTGKPGIIPFHKGHSTFDSTRPFCPHDVLKMNASGTPFRIIRGGITTSGSTLSPSDLSSNGIAMP
jgi:hypothetical protein